MAENKYSFVLYVDWIHTFEKLSNERAGELIKHVFRYVNDLNPAAPNEIVDLVFEPIKQQLKRDLKKWEKKSVVLSDNGRIGGIKSGESRRNKLKQIEANGSDASYSKQIEANEAVLGTVIGTVTEIQLTPKQKEFKESFDGWLEMRKKIKKPATKRAEELAKTELRKLAGKDIDLAIKIINQSTVGCWTSFYELKAGKQIEGRQPRPI